MRAETESTFDVASSAAMAVVTALNAVADSGVGVGRRKLRCRSVTARARTYLYLRTDTADRTDRLIFEYRGCEITGRLSSKRWVGASGHATKYHSDDGDAHDLGAWAAALEDLRPVGSALFKIRQRYTLRARNGDGCKIGFDAMVPISPDAPTVMGSPFFHLEIEAIDQCEPDSVMRALGLLHAQLGSLEKTTCSKRELAARTVTRASRLPGKSGRDLRDHLDRVYGAATASFDRRLVELLTTPCHPRR